MFLKFKIDKDDNIEFCYKTDSDKEYCDSYLKINGVSLYITTKLSYIIVDAHKYKSIPDNEKSYTGHLKFIHKTIDKLYRKEKLKKN